MQNVPPAHVKYVAGGLGRVFGAIDQKVCVLVCTGMCLPECVYACSPVVFAFRLKSISSYAYITIATRIESSPDKRSQTRKNEQLSNGNYLNRIAACARGISPFTCVHLVSSLLY